MQNLDGEKLSRKAMPMQTGSAKRSVGTEGLWIFVFIDMMIFALIFLVFMGERLNNYEVYAASQKHLNDIFGLANTLVLLTSSWLVVEAIRGARNGNPAITSRCLLLSVLLGAGFCVNKIVEYYLKIESGINVATNPFFTFYFFITFVHFLHVIAGMIFLVAFQRRASECASPRYVTGLENVGLFWHYVDVLWIFIFPLLYLVA